MSLSASELGTIMMSLHELGVEGIEYCGGGEPTMNPHLCEATEIGIDMGFKFGMLTNGTLLSNKMLALISEEFSYIRFSVDTFDKERYCRKRRTTTKQYDAMFDALNVLKDNRRRSGKLWVGVKLLIDVSDYDYYDILNSLDVCARLCVDSVQIKVAEDIEKPTDMFDKLDEIHDTIQQNNYPFMVRMDRKKTIIKEQCWMNPMQLTIDAHGNAYICCYYQHRKDTHFLCNVLEDDIVKYWGSDAHIEKIKQIKIPECNVYNCRWHNYHKLGNMIVNDVFQLEFC